jgi:hypothetical protein
VDGTSLLHPIDQRILTIEHYAPKGSERQVPSYCGIRTETGKYVRYRTGFVETYDLVEDPYELQSKRRGPMVDRLRPIATEACARNLPPGMRW